MNIVISKENATAITGSYTNNTGFVSVLNPIPIPENLYILPEAVLQDMNFAGVHDVIERMIIRRIEINKLSETVEEGKYYITAVGIVKCIESGTIDLTDIDEELDMPAFNPLKTNKFIQ
jgi:hypothetical protein